jgi:hypothetical protein
MVLTNFHRKRGSMTASETTVYSIKIQRRMPRSPRTSLQEQLDHILGIALRGARGTTQGWVCVNQDKKEHQDSDGMWLGTATLYFEKTRGHKNDTNAVSQQWDVIQEMIAKAGCSSQFNKYPWTVIDEDVTVADDEELREEGMSVDEENEETTGKKPAGVKREVPSGVYNICGPSDVLTIEDLKEKFPHDLLNGTDEYIENHEAFKGIYGRGPQIRSVLSTIWSFITSGGERANHTLLYGPPACAKTSILLRILGLFGEGAVLRLDSTSTTRAGLERMIFKQLEVVPPLFMCEEIEKADEAALRIWLGAMDDRHEFRKVNFHMQQVRKVYFLALATANDKEKFDGMMGGRPGAPGALSSRYVHQWECPRPNQTQMRLILQRDIARFGGKMEWVEPCVALATEVSTDDPRRVLGFLDGGDRLLDGSYQNDVLAGQPPRKKP